MAEFTLVTIVILQVLLTIGVGYAISAYVKERRDDRDRVFRERNRFMYQLIEHGITPDFVEDETEEIARARA